MQKHSALSKPRWIANTYMTTLEGGSLLPSLSVLGPRHTCCGKMHGKAIVSVLVCKWKNLATDMQYGTILPGRYDDIAALIISAYFLAAAHDKRMRLYQSLRYSPHPTMQPQHKSLLVLREAMYALDERSGNKTRTNNLRMHNQNLRYYASHSTPATVYKYDYWILCSI